MVKKSDVKPLKKALDTSYADIQLEYFILKITDYLRVKDQSINPAVSRQFREIRTSLIRARDTALIGSYAYNRFFSVEKRTEAIDTLQQNTLTKILCLPKSGSHLFIAGYTELSNESIDGHAVAFEVICRGNAYDITVFNTGEGAEFHDKAGKRKVFPLQWKGFSYTSIQEITLGLEGWVYGTLTSIKQIYDLLDSHAKERITRPEGYAPYSEQGIIGSCNHKAIRVWIHHKLRAFAPNEYWSFRQFCTRDLLDQVKKIEKADCLTIPDISDMHLTTIKTNAKAVFNKRAAKNRTF